MRSFRALAAAAAVSGILTMMAAPSAAFAQKPPDKTQSSTKTTTTKPATQKATAPKTTRTTPKVSAPKAPVARSHTTTHVTTHATTTHMTTHATTPRVNAHAANGHATTHMTTRATTRTTTHVNTKSGAVKTTTTTKMRTTVVKSVSPQIITRVRTESVSRIKTFALKPTRIAHAVIVQPAVLARLKVKRVNLKNVTFVTGTVVSRTPSLVMLRTASGLVPVTTNNITIVRNILVPGQTVIVPAQVVGNGFVMVPAFTSEDEDNFANEPFVAPCATNDNDADDAGDTGTFAPPGSCQVNDGDADDGYVIPALPASFAPPGLFSSAFQPVLASGVVVAQSGSNLVLLTPNFTPLVVNASAAISAGATNGPLSVGRYVTVYGYDINNSMVATSLI